MADQLNMNGLSLNGGSYIPPHMRGKIGAAGPQAVNGGPPSMNGGLPGSAWAGNG